jgi:hypothetical protein
MSFVTRPPHTVNAPHRHHGVRIALLLLVLLAILFATSGASPREAASSDTGVAVRYTEGTVHGFLRLSTPGGEVHGHGDLFQIVKDGAIQSRMVFHLKGSVFDERTTYTQNGVFRLQSYRLQQSGPLFDHDMDVTLSGSGAYTVRTKSRDDGKEEVLEGKLDLPADVYNGMVTTIAKNLPQGGNIHYVAFGPKPRIVDLEFEPAGMKEVVIGSHREKVQHLLVKPHLGLVMRSLAKLTGKSPPDGDLWIVRDEVPAFVRWDGPLGGHVRRIDITSPTWP